MVARVRLETRQAGSGRSNVRKRETVILRDGEVVAVLPEGDPLRYTLELSVDELRAMRVNLASVLEKRPRVREVLEAIIEYKGNAEPKRRPQ